MQARWDEKASPSGSIMLPEIQPKGSIAQKGLAQ
jgi:hypothetical protein